MSSLRTEDPPTPPANGWPPKTLHSVPVTSGAELRALMCGTAAVEATAVRVTEGLGEAAKMTLLLRRLVMALLVVVFLLVTLVGIASASLWRVSSSASTMMHVVGDGMTPQQIRAVLDSMARSGGNVEVATSIGRNSMAEVQRAVVQAVLSLNTSTQILSRLNTVAGDFASRGTIQIGVPHAH